MTAGLHSPSSAPPMSSARFDDLPAALAPLAAERRWLVWRWETNEKGKPTKVPYRGPDPTRHAASDKPATWCDYETAAAAVAAGRADGVGFALMGSEFAAFDIDDCRDRETHEIAPWAMDLIERAGSYAEVTVGGEGVRIIGRAGGEHVHRNQKVPDVELGRIETYRQAKRYIVVTGTPLEDSPTSISDIDPLIDETVSWLDQAAAAARDAKREAAQRERAERRQTISERAQVGLQASSLRTQGDLPRELDELVRFGPAAGADRSAAFHHAVGWLKDYGWSPDGIEAMMAAHPGGVAEKYDGRLRAEIERCWDKADARAERPQSRNDGGQGRQRERAEAKPIPLRWHRDASSDADRSWLVRDLIAETGKGLLSGQWGSAKTFIALDLSGCVMTGESFANRPVLRRGGVLFIAPEGAFEIPIRLKGLVTGKLAGAAMAQAAGGERSVDPDDLPFAWIEECPRLVERDAAESLILTADAAARELRERYDLPLALIIVDTVAAGAGFDDENSAAETQKAMNALERLSHHTGAFVLGVDHFGKAVETGTRGSSAKEAAADTVLAALATRDEAGNVSNTRLAVRKVRGGRTGQEIPYCLDVVEIGQDRWGEAITTCVVNWQVEAAAASPTADKGRWPTSLKVFRAAMLNALAEHSCKVRPFGLSGPEVVAVQQQHVRDEFAASYPADGDTPAQKAEAKKKAFQRAVKAAQAKGLISTRDVGGVDHFWFADAEQDDRDTHTGQTGHS